MAYPFKNRTHFGIPLSVTFLLIFVCACGLWAQEAPSWVDFGLKKKSGDMLHSVLLDFSYAGYHFSEKEIPDVSPWNTVSVTDYGATPDDETYDDAGIQAAIDAAEALGVPTVVFFPAGKYMVSSTETQNTPIVVSKSNIVLKGAGSGIGGTEIYTDKYGNKPWRFHFKPNSTPNATLATISRRIYRGDLVIHVNDVSKLAPGMTVELYHQGIENLEANMPGLIYNPIWNTGNRGVRTLEKHLITKIEGEMVTFKNPVNFTMTADKSGAQLKEYNTIEEVGVEDILFTSAWKVYPEVYALHANDIVDYAWRALAFENVKNGWIQNVQFRDWNEDLMIEKCMAITVRNISVTGKQGHTSYFSRYSYGVLFENCRDYVPVGFKGAGGQGHGPGMRWSTTGSVFLNCKMQEHQSIDCHGYHPYGNLLDNVYGGCFRGNGGNEGSYPNSGPDLTFWNFVHASNYNHITFDFWDPVSRKTYTYPYPKFVGFTSPGENITLKNYGLNQMQGTQVYPKSLFEAQLQLRLYGAYATASSEQNGHKALNLIDENADSYWAPGDVAIGQYLMLDLGAKEAINAIRVTDIQKAIKTFTLACWVEGAWVNVDPVSLGTTEKNWTFDRVITRKIKLTIDALNDGAKDVKIAEFVALKDSTAPKPAQIALSLGDTTVIEGYHVELEALLANNGAALNKVDLFIDDALIRTASEAPFKWGHDASPNPTELDSLPVGEYTLRAVATDVYGLQSSAEAILRVEINLGNKIPVCRVSGTLSESKYPAALAIDGDYDDQSRWSGKGRGATLVMDLCETCQIDKVGLTWYLGNRLNYKFELYVSTDSVNWTNVFAGSSNRLNDIEVFYFENVRGRYLRYLGLGSNSSSRNAVIECEIFGQIVTSSPNLKNKGQNFAVFPNPSSSGVFHLREAAQWEVYSLTGKKILAGESQVIDLSAFTRGFYVLNIDNTVGKILFE